MSLWLWVSGHVGKDWVGKPPNLDFQQSNGNLIGQIYNQRFLCGFGYRAMLDRIGGKPPSLDFSPEIKQFSVSRVPFSNPVPWNTDSFASAKTI